MNASRPVLACLILASAVAAARHTQEQPASPAPPGPLASDWTTTGWDCTLFAAGDIDADGFDDVLTLNGWGQLCVAYTVEGWKASPWEALAEGLAPGAVALVAADLVPEAGGDEVAIVRPEGVTMHHALDAGKFAQAKAIPVPEGGAPLAAARLVSGLPVITDAAGAAWTIQGDALAPAPPPGEPTPATPPADPPPYEPESPLVGAAVGDFNADGLADTIGVFTCARPHQHRVLRLVLAPNAASGDADSDGLADADEAVAGSNPLDRDTDDDGLLDGWEVHGLPRGIDAGADTRLSPVRQDVIVAVAPYEGVDQAAMLGELARAAQLYAGLPTTNPDGSSGIRLHFRVDAVLTPDKQFGGSWQAAGDAAFPARERGLMHWMQITPWGGGQAMQTGDMGGCGNGWAVFAHEFGHQLSLSHEGDSAAAWCPLYPSLMNYAFSYALGGDANAIRFSDGRFRQVALDERNLMERLPFPYADLKYLETWPFRFPLQDDGAGGTRIDWNQNGVFDDAPVTADINYGSASHAGIRRTHDLIGAAPALVYVGDTCHLVTLAQNRAGISIRAYKGAEQWSDARAVPASATDADPVALGTPTHGYVFFRQIPGWSVARFTADAVEGPFPLPALPRADLSAAAVGGRVLLVSRDDADALRTFWLDWPDKPALTPGQTLELRSQVPPGLALDPGDGRLVVASSAPNSRGGQMCLRVTRFAVQGDRLVEEETRWTRGEGSGNNCTTRPVVAFTPAGQLCIFHTGWPSPEGLMTAWRTTRVGNLALDEGWLTCMLYDIWTLTRVGIGFADGPQGAVFAFRWDAGDYGEWKINTLLLAHNGWGIDPEPMRDFNDADKISLWGIRHSILTMRRE